MSHEATEKISQAVEIAKEQARQAINEFDREWESIQRMASNSIDLFSGSAISQVSDIATKTRKACDNLYTTCQSLILSIDSTCRPFITDDVDPSAVKTVAELIEWLNEKSEIDNKFSASLNGSRLGDVASRQYLPSIECKMIQNFWENSYRNLPNLAEKLEEKRKDEAKTSLKAEKENRAKEKKYQKEMEEYENKLHLWKEECDKIERVCKTELEERVSVERKRIAEISDQKYHATVEKLHQEIDKTNNTIASVTQSLNSLGFFAFGEKSTCKKIIKVENSALETLQLKLTDAAAEYAQSHISNEKYISDFTQKVEIELKKKYPLPTRPTPPSKPKKVSPPKKNDGFTPPKSHKDIKDIADAIVDFLSSEPDRAYTQSELMADCDALEGCSQELAIAILTQLIIKGTVERIKEKRTVYFKIVC